MTINELQRQLEEAYSVKNLNKISLTLINLYQNQQYSILQKIAEIIGDFMEIEITSEGKGFSKLIRLYHPDRSEFYQNDIQRLVGLNDFDGLLEHTHILKLERIEEIAGSLSSYEDIDYSPVYEWDIDREGYSYINLNRKTRNKKFTTRPKGYDFFDAMKLRQYGRLDVEFPFYYLEDIDEFELSSSDIVRLDGIEFCIHASTIDLSENRIVDLSPLTGLKQLEELNLADNRIAIIDDLYNLSGLKRLNLSNNQIDDISTLFELVRLEYVDLTGNKISADQIERLAETGVKVDY
jgi:Leucine-rich repeat (LRR) protein